MRPIDKGPCPQVNGQDKAVSSYTDWRRDLISRIGSYCVYCNMPLSHQLNVEHVVPKKPQPGQPAGNLLAWENMLLACGPCNRAKSNKPSDSSIHYLPEFHNGLLPFKGVFVSGVPDSLVIVAKAGLTPAQIQKAQKTIDDFGLARVDTRGAVVDIRWKKRWGAMNAVKAAKDILDMAKHSSTYDPHKAGELIATLAKEIGFFLLWFEEFASDPNVLKCLADPSLFPGIASNCFDSITFQPIPRNPSDPSDSI